MHFHGVLIYTTSIKFLSTLLKRMTPAKKTAAVKTSEQTAETTLREPVPSTAQRKSSTGMVTGFSVIMLLKVPESVLKG